MLFMNSSSDEASAKLRFDYNSKTEQSTSTALQLSTPLASSKKPVSCAEVGKVLQYHLQIGTLVYDKLLERHLYFSNNLPCPLLDLDRGTAETLHFAHKLIHDIPGLAELRQEFGHVVFAQTQDRCAANERQINAARREDLKNGCSRLHLGCDIHRAATISTRCYDLVKDDVSGLLALSLAERGSGRFPLLKQMLTDLCLKRLRIVRGGVFRPGSEAFEHRRAFVQVTLPNRDPRASGGTLFRPRSIANFVQRIRYEHLFNGDVADREYIWHYVSPDGPSNIAIKRLFRDHVAEALLPTLLPHFPRHRWTGSHDVIKAGLLLSGTHGLLHQVIPMWGKAVLGEPVPMCSSIAPVAQPKPEGDGYESQDEPAEASTALVVQAADFGPDMSFPKDSFPQTRVPHITLEACEQV